LIFASGIVLMGVVSRDLPYNWIISSAIMVTISIVIAFSIGLIKIKDMYSIIKHDK